MRTRRLSMELGPSRRIPANSKILTREEKWNKGPTHAGTPYEYQRYLATNMETADEGDLEFTPIDD
jgi:hypothetical protein